MKKVLFLILSLVLITGCVNFTSDCVIGSGNIIQKDVEVRSFSSVELEGTGNIFLEQTNQTSLRVQGEDNVLENLKFVELGDKLIIKRKDYVCFNNIKPINYYITLRDVDELKISGSGTITSQAKLITKDLDVRIDGSGTILLDVVTESLKTRISGSGDVTLSGITQDLDLRIDGSGKIRAYELKARNVETTTTGSGDIYVSPETLDVKILSSGSVYYKGEPTITRVDIEGSGKVRKQE
ncbi:DUF2807 domain-containing protein [Candidatus Woesearchaeota archaeon]|nr:DUF2807 domain-containing protein [Candidatus Woesearchaeota archaeon]